VRRTMTLVAACVLLFAACGGDEEEPSAGGQDQPQEEAAATIEVASASLGDILADPDGNTLYMFVPDQEEDGEPTCYDDCAEAWPAFEATGELTAGEGLDQSLLASVDRTDGTSQVTYNDLPLYYFSGDEAAGDTNGQGLMDVWYVVSPEGEPVEQT
jgi:predicted lipoprotein with Yx(FWY)xxD motif